MRIVHSGCAAIFLLLSGVIAASAEHAMAPDRDAGTWKTWVISSGKDFRVPPPPDRGATEKEAVEVAKLTASRDQAGSTRSPIGILAGHPIAGASSRPPST